MAPEIQYIVLASIGLTLVLAGTAAATVFAVNRKFVKIKNRIDCIILKNRTADELPESEN